MRWFDRGDTHCGGVISRKGLWCDVVFRRVTLRMGSTTSEEGCCNGVYDIWIIACAGTRPIDVDFAIFAE